MHAVVTAELARRLTAEWTLSYAEYEVLVALTDHPEGSLRLFEIAGRLGWNRAVCRTRSTKR